MLGALLALGLAPGRAPGRRFLLADGLDGSSSTVSPCRRSRNHPPPADGGSKLAPSEHSRFPVACRVKLTTPRQADSTVWGLCAQNATDPEILRAGLQRLVPGYQPAGLGLDVSHGRRQRTCRAVSLSGAQGGGQHDSVSLDL